MSKTLRGGYVESAARKSSGRMARVNIDGTVGNPLKFRVPKLRNVLAEEMGLLDRPLLGLEWNKIRAVVARGHGVYAIPVDGHAIKLG